MAYARDIAHDIISLILRMRLTKLQSFAARTKNLPKILQGEWICFIATEACSIVQRKCEMRRMMSQASFMCSVKYIFQNGGIGTGAQVAQRQNKIWLKLRKSHTDIGNYTCLFPLFIYCCQFYRVGWGKRPSLRGKYSVVCT